MHSKPKVAVTLEFVVNCGICSGARTVAKESTWVLHKFIISRDFQASSFMSSRILELFFDLILLLFS